MAGESGLHRASALVDGNFPQRYQAGPHAE